MKKRLLVLLAGSIFCLNGYSQEFSGGDGSTETPYLIKSVKDLTELATVVNGGNTLSGKTLRMESDITYGTSDSYTLIGFTGTGIAKKFAGTLDGNNHSISGLKLNGTKYVSMFASVADAGVIKNLTLKAPDLTCSDSYGGFIAAQVSGLIENCNVENGNMISTSGSYKGGIVGYLQGTVKDCNFSGSITTTNSIGGIVGQNYGNVENCSCSATIISVSENSASVHVGGIASISLKLGDNTPTITDSYFIGSIMGSVLNNCGGICATFNKAVMERCWNAGYISASGNSGGLLGTLESGTLKDCYNIGTIYNNVSEAVGGLVGYQSSTVAERIIENCLSLGSIFNSILARNEGSEIVGTGVSGEMTIKNTFFDLQIAGWSNNQYAKTTKELTAASGISGFDVSVWKFTEGMYPRLIKSADKEVAILNATPFYLADEEQHGKVYSDFEVSTANDVEWEIKNGTLAKLEGNTVKVTRGAKIENVVLSSYLGNYEKKSLISVYPRIFKGEGTENDPYLIESKEDMIKLSDATNTQAISFTNEYFKMTQDIDMELDETFIPFCFNSNVLAFDGIFDGNGHSIKNLAIDALTNEVLHVGLFRTIFKNGIVKNLTIDKSCQFKIYRNFGTFTETLYGTLDNCHNYATVSSSDGYSGGLVAFVEETGIVRNCYNEAPVSAQNKNGYVAGIAYTNKGTIEYCQNNGNVTATFGGARNVGGIAGANSGVIKNVLNAGQVTAGDIVGGICATNAKTGQLVNVLSLGTVIATASKDNLGSITGQDAGAQYSNVYYDKQIVIYKDLLKNVEGISTANLTKASWKGFGEEEVWVYTNGKYPMLKNFMNNKASKLAAMPVIFNNDNNREQISSDAALPALDGLTWTLKNGNAFKIENGTLKIPLSNTYTADILTGTYYGYQKTFSIATLGNILEGKGNAESPWLISSTADLIKLSAEVSKSQNDYSEKYFKFTGDIDMTGASFIPIAAGGITYFNGIVDGNNKTITNLTIKAASDTHVGLFGRVGANGQISNLTIGKGSSIEAKQYAGAFAGRLDGSISNCKNYASVSVTNGYAGGFAGVAYQSGTLTNLVNEGNINSSKDCAGGIIGEIKADVYQITKVSNSGKIDGVSKTGGIAGAVSNLVIKEAINLGTITGKGQVGGICGYLTGTDTICNSINKGEINGDTEIGGIAGYNSKSSSDKDIYIFQSYNAGNVTATNSTAAGIIARGMSPEISECYNTGNVTNSKTNLSSSTPGAAGIIGKGNPVITDCYNMGTISAYNNIGGLISYPNSTYSNMTVTNSYSAGAIVCNNESAKSIGTILGKNGKITMDNCFYDRQVSGFGATGGAEDNIGVNTQTLTQTTLGKVWKSVEGCYPILVTFSTDDIAKLYSAPIFLSTEGTEDTYSNVTHNFKVSTANNITWMGDNIFTINGENISIAPNTKGEYKLTARLGEYSRDITVTVNYLSVGIEEFTNDSAPYQVVDGGIIIKEISKYAVYTLSGILLQENSHAATANEFIPLEKGIYLIKVNNKVYKIATTK